MFIPKIIHQIYWDFYGNNKEIPREWKDYCQTWKEIFPEPEYKHILWDDKDNENLIREKYPWFLKVFLNYPRNIQRADAIRYFILYEYGGIYVDMDYSVRKNFYHLLDNDKINISQSPYNKKHLMNCLMASRKKHIGWKKILSSLKKYSNYNSTIESTGPRFLTKNIDSQIVNILSVKDFNPPNPSISKFRRLFTIAKNIDEKDYSYWEDSYCNHHGTESWGKEEAFYYIKKNFPLLLVILLSIIAILKKYIIHN